MLRIHLWTLPRWFAAPFFGSMVLLGAVMAGGITADSLVALAAGLLIMAGGHSFNSYLDYAWTGLDKGRVEDRSAEKDYTGGQSLLVTGAVSERGVILNAVSWYALAAVPLIYLGITTGWMVVVAGLLGMLVTFWYSWAKFNWTHELSLGVAVGPLPVLIGMFATNPAPPWANGLLASIPSAAILAFAGLAVDEWPDAEANIKKGVRSIAYKVWENGVSLEWYVSAWVGLIYVYQVFLISLGVLASLTGLTLLVWPLVLFTLVLMKRDFRRHAVRLIIIAAAYPVLLVAGQALN